MNPVRFAASCLALIAVIVIASMLSCARYSAYFVQPGARTFLMELGGVLALYAAGCGWIATRRRGQWPSILRIAALCGVTGGLLEASNIAIENGIPFAVQGPALQVGFMVAVFASWAVAGYWAARETKSLRVGALTAAISAGVCMLIAVAAGSMVELFLRPPAPAYVATWGEYRRSGWTDAHAFAMANTFDSGFSHLLIAPPMALLLGLIGSVLGRARGSRASCLAGGALRVDARPAERLQG